MGLRDFFMGAAQQGIKGGQQASMEGAQQTATSQLSAQNAQQGESAEKLKALLQGQAQAQSLQQAQGTLQALGKLFPGRKMNVKSGSADISEAQQQLPYTAMLRPQMAEDAARKHAVDFYNRGSAGLESGISAVNAIDDATQRNDQGSLGQARGAMVASMGFKRFNNEEGVQNAPGDTKQQIYATGAKYGIDPNTMNRLLGAPDGALNASDLQAIQGFSTGKKKELMAQHVALKAQAGQTYNSSSFATPAGSDVIGKLGAPLDARMQSWSAPAGSPAPAAPSGQAPLSRAAWLKTQQQGPGGF